MIYKYLKQLFLCISVPAKKIGLCTERVQGKWDQMTRSRQWPSGIKNCHDRYSYILETSTCRIISGKQISPFHIHCGAFKRFDGLCSLELTLHTFYLAVHIFTKCELHQSQPRSKLAMINFSHKNKIWSNFSRARLERWSVATKPPQEKSRSTLVELGGGVKCWHTTFISAFCHFVIVKGFEACPSLAW